MDARAYLGLEPTDDPLRFRMPLERHHLTPGMFLYGGAGLAAAVEAMEIASGRPCRWATAQYLSFATMPAELTVEVVLEVHGHQTTQARAIVRKGDTEILMTLGTLGSRPSVGEVQWAERPDVPSAEESPQRAMHGDAEGTAMDLWSVRRAAGVDWEGLAQGGDLERSGRSALWIKVPGGPRLVNAADLALAGDHVPSGAAGALGKMVGGNSLDNTIRVASLVPTGWILADVRIHAVHDGFGHGLCHLWAEDGTLLGTASQSFIVRAFDPGRLKRQG